MSLEQKLQKIDKLQEKINSYGRLPDDVLKKINYKFRLEWNYTSNSMEGNSLTKSETRSVMIGNITVSGKPIKDVLEVKGHDEVINTIIKMGKGELNVSEKRIKEIHAGIMHEENPEKRTQIGQWKKDQNYLYNYKDERFDFVAPADVPERMHQLVNWINAEREKITRKSNDALHPVMLALKFNLDYVSIHPFYDGNGRTSRILTNLILIAYGFPPLYIKEDERSKYYQYLGDIQGYGGQPDVFFEYMADLIIRSQELVMKAIGGEELEEPDDLEKEIHIWKKMATSAAIEAPRRDDKAVYELYSNCLKELFQLFISKHHPFIDMFEKTNYAGLKNHSGRGNMEWLYNELDGMEYMMQDPIGLGYPDTFKNIEVVVRLEEYKHNERSAFTIESRLKIDLSPYRYSLRISSPGKYGYIFIEKRYDESLNADEIERIVANAVKHTFGKIKMSAGDGKQ